MSGIFGVVSNKRCVDDLFLGTFYVQHRAQDCCGLFTHDGKEFSSYPEKGLLRHNFPADKRKKMSGTSGVGSVSTDMQPIAELSSSGGLITCFDGNIINYDELTKDLLREGSTFSGYQNPKEVNDSVLVSKIISLEVNFEKGIESLIDAIKGDFAIISLTEEGVYAARGWGRKPLILGEKEGSYAVSSESNSFENTGFEIYRDVKPGEVVLLNRDGIHTVKKFDLDPVKFGTFEWIYTSHPASVVDGKSVSAVRKEMGRLLAKRYPAEADIVSPYPNSGRWHAIGYAQQSNIPYEEVFVRYDYSDRSYTPGNEAARYEEGRTKLIPVRDSIADKSIIMVDDSIVRGTQTLTRTGELRRHGAKEVHGRIACPALLHACMYGKTTKDDDDCIARRMSFDGIQKRLQLDSLGYATIEDLELATGFPKEELCLECWQ